MPVPPHPSVLAHHRVNPPLLEPGTYTVDRAAYGHDRVVGSIVLSPGDVRGTEFVHERFNIGCWSLVSLRPSMARSSRRSGQRPRHRRRLASTPTWSYGRPAAKIRPRRRVSFLLSQTGTRPYRARGNRAGSRGPRDLVGVCGPLPEPGGVVMLAPPERQYRSACRRVTHAITGRRRLIANFMARPETVIRFVASDSFREKGSHVQLAKYEIMPSCLLCVALRCSRRWGH
jgi:hypothetical protein